MKNILKMSVIALAVTMSASVFAASNGGLTCEGKKTEISNQIEYAKKANNVAQVAGLEKSLKEVETHCTNADLQKKHQEKLHKKTEKLKEKQADLKRAEVKGDAAKIAKQKEKVKHAQKEVKEAKTNLDTLNSTIKAQ